MGFFDGERVPVLPWSRVFPFFRWLVRRPGQPIPPFIPSIRLKQCILLLGQGVSVDPNDLDGKTLPARLANLLASKLKKHGEGNRLIDEDNFAHVARIYEREMPKTRKGLEMEVQNFHAAHHGKTTQLHRDLAALPFTLCITTSPDRYLLNAFAATPGKTPIHGFYHFQPHPRRMPRRSLCV